MRKSLEVITMLSRREFLKTGAAATFVSGPFFSGYVYAEGTADLAAVTGASIDAAVRAAVAEVGGIGAFVKKGNQVIVKPNLSFASAPDRAATTNPEVLQAVIRLCLEAGAKKVLVVDHPLQDAEIIGTRADVAQMVKQTKNALLILPTTENLYEEVPIPRGKEMKSTKMAKILKEAEVLINLPVAKSHSATGVSFGIKGNMGLNWDRKWMHDATDLNQTIADLATIVKPNLTILDAVRALTTRGPQGPGKVAKLDTILAGRDPVAVDAYAVTLTPWYNQKLAAKNVAHLVKSAELGVGEIDTSKLKVVKKTV
jgi:uncharacterized protein (DUF362 family)